MKKWTLALLAFCFLTGLAYGQAPEARAATGHAHHCYCNGNSSADHVCENSATWTAVTGSLTAEEGGHYYLESNIAAAITVKDGNSATLCLNGHSLRAQCPIMVYGGGTLNICDCAGSGIIRSSNPGNSSAKGSVVLISSSKTGGFGTVNLYSGTITGTSSTAGISCRTVEVKGGVFHMYGGTITGGVSDGSLATDSKPGYGGSVCVYTHEEHTGSFTMYGGTITGGSSAAYGGNIYGDTSSYIAILGGTVENGSSTRGGNIYCNGNVTLDGATITGGTASMYRGNVYINGLVDLSKNTVTDGTAGGKPETVRLLRNGTHLVSDHITLQDAVTKQWNDTSPETLHLQLSGDVTEKRSFAQDIYLDLNGYSLSGITLSGKLYGMDSTGGGKLSCTLSGGQILGIGEYFPVPEGDGSYSFHSMTATVTHISIDPAKAAMGYKTQLYLADSVLDRVSQYGYDLWLEGQPVRSFAKPFDRTNTQLTLRLKHILSPAYSREQNAAHVDIPIHAKPFVILNDGTKLDFNEVAFSLHEALESADDLYSTYNQAQKTALNTLFQDYYYLIKYWHVENFHHMQSGTWTQLSSKGLLALVRQNNSTGNYTGTYVLTEDVDLGATTVTLKEGADLTLCLDGHSITGTKQLFRIEGGTLTICDCHDGNDPGTLTSTLSATTGVFAPVAQITNNGTLNLYGGQLQGQNIVRSAGVVAVGHQTKESNASFNMYGGSISDGLADYNGGLVTVWHGSTLNMYGGALYGGQCNGDGGGLVVRDGSTANLYGGEIYNCTSGKNGGGIWVTNEGSCYLGNVNLHNNTAAGNGGNVYMDNANVIVDGATVSHGQADKMGGGIFVNSETIHLTGTTRIENNTATIHGKNMHLYYDGAVCADGLTQGANVRLSGACHGKVGTDDAIASYLHSDDEGFVIKNKGGEMVLWNSDLLSTDSPSGFSAGYAQVCITPTETGIPLAGYGESDSRTSTKIDGELYVTATAITDESGQTVLFLTADVSTMTGAQLEPILRQVSYYTGIPRSHIFSATSHTHSGPALNSSNPKIIRYRHLLPDLFAQAAVLAMNDRKSATMYTGSFDVGGNNGYGLNFTRHYQFLRGGVLEYSCDNFGERTLNDNAAITDVRHVTQADPTMHLVKFERESGNDILMVNWRAHATMTGGTKDTVISSDYVGAMREAVKADTGMDVIFFQGAAGNINPVSRLEQEMHNLTFRQYGQELSDQIQAAISGGCLTQYDPGLWQVDNYSYTATVDHSDDARYEAASAFVKEYYEKFPGNQADQAERLAWCAERGWSCVFEASSIVRRYNKKVQTEQMPLNTLALGNHLAFFTAPGELWDTVSQQIEENSPYNTTFCVGYSMDSFSYFVYDPNTGGILPYDSYEGFNRNFVAPDTICDMIDYWQATLSKLYQN